MKRLNHGVGKKVSIDVCEKANVDSNTRVNDLSESEIKNISDELGSDVFLGLNFKNKILMKGKKLFYIKSKWSIINT